jgi:CRP-like cAMP-binding protein
MVDNYLLQALSSEDRARLELSLRRVTLKVGEVLYQPGDAVTHVWFPLSGLISIISVLGDGTEVESSIVGREGAIAFIEAGGAGEMHSRILVQGSGEALVAPAARYRTAFDESQSLRHAVSQHTELLLAEARQEIACHGAHAASARLARWLLVCADKSGSPDLEMTQDLLATMIATQRTTVSGIAAEFQSEKLIQYARGRIKITDAPGLEAKACECYATMKALRGAMGQPGS